MLERKPYYEQEELEYKPWR